MKEEVRFLVGKEVPREQGKYPLTIMFSSRPRVCVSNNRPVKQIRKVDSVTSLYTHMNGYVYMYS